MLYSVLLCQRLAAIFAAPLLARCALPSLRVPVRPAEVCALALPAPAKYVRRRHVLFRGRGDVFATAAALGSHLHAEVGLDYMQGGGPGEDGGAEKGPESLKGLVHKIRPRRAPIWMRAVSISAFLYYGGAL